MTELKNKVAIVTGGARGIGFAICEALGAAGCDVIIADICEDTSREATQRLVQAGYVCEPYKLDVTQEDSVRGMVQLPAAEWNRVLSVNLFGVFLCCREVGLVMAKQGGGRIINIASLNSVSPVALTAAYNVSKAGVASLTQTLAAELAPFGVNVNAISPGPIETAITRAIG